MPTKEESLKDKLAEFGLLNTKPEGYSVAAPNSQHIYHHYDDQRSGSFNFKVEKNSRGFNYEITIQGARSEEEGRALLEQVDRLVKEYISSQEEE